MEELILAILTASLTIIGAVIIFIIKKIIEEYYINPYSNLKKNLIELKIFLNFNSNILTNKFYNKEILDEFRKNILNIQKELRKIWSKLNVDYDICPKRILLWKINIPSNEEMAKIETTLIYLSNIPLIKYEFIKEDGDNILERIKRFDEIVKIITKYLTK